VLLAVSQAFRPCGSNLAEFFKNTGWALFGRMSGFSTNRLAIRVIA
jgi:hypothetical protein